ncbi:MAG TPA: TSUP family transporter, partial [Thermodesulfobacteriota bacterium]
MLRAARIVPEAPASRETRPLLAALATSPAAAALGAVGLAFAAFVKGAIGAGFPVIAAPIVASFVDPQTTIIAVSVPGLAMNLLQLSGGERLVGIVRRHLPFLVVAVASTTVGALLVRRLDPDVIRVALGLVTLGWLALGLFKVSVAITP